MATRTKRIEMRADPDSEARIARAAELQQLSVSAFVLGAAGREADRVLSRDDRTIMSADQFDELMSSIDVADPAGRLRAAARAKRSFERR